MAVRLAAEADILAVALRRPRMLRPQREEGVLRMGEGAIRAAEAMRVADIAKL
jgi:hypothetical protein